MTDHSEAQDSLGSDIPPFAVCAVLGDGAGPDAVVQASLDGKAVFCPGETVDEVIRYDFEGVDTMPHPGGEKVLQHAAGLAECFSNGQSSTLAVVGEDAATKDGLLFGSVSQGSGGLIEEVVARSFARLRDQVQFRSVVRVSWIRVSREGLTDVLREAGNRQRRKTHSSSGDEHSGPVLALRDDPNLGVVVPGLWEVEVSSAHDVGTLLQRARPPHDASLGDHHAVTITVHRSRIVSADEQAAASPASSSLRPQAGSTVTQLRFLRVGNASAADEGPGAASDGVQGWVRSLQRVLRAIEKEEAFVPFAKSRVTQLLSPLLRATQPGLVVACAPRDVSSLAAAAATIKFASRLRRLARRLAGYGVYPPSLRETLQDRSATGSWAFLRDTADKNGHHGQEHSTSLASSANMLASQLHSSETVTPAAAATRAGGSGYSAEVTSSPLGRAAQSLTGKDPRVVDGNDPSGATHGHEQRPPQQQQQQQQPPPQGGGGWLDTVLQSAEQHKARASELEERVSSLERENVSLRELVDTLEGELDQAKVDPHPVPPGPARNKIRALREQLRAKEQEIHDYELYKDVVERALERMRVDVQKLASERDDARRRLRSARQAAQKERTEAQRLRERLQEREMQLESTALDASQREEALRYSLESTEARCATKLRNQQRTGGERQAEEAARLRERAAAALQGRTPEGHHDGDAEEVLAAGLRSEMSRRWEGK